MTTQSIFKELINEPRLQHLLSGWCIDDSSFSIHASQEYEQDELTDISNFSYLNCSEIKLSSKWSKSEIEDAGFISTNLKANQLLESILKAYSSYFSFEQALLKTKISYHQNVSYFITEPNGDHQYVKFSVGEIVEATLPNKQQSEFSIIKGIIKHIWNDDQIYVFIYLNWLKDLRKYDDLLQCPIYRLQHSHNNFQDEIHPISIVSRSSDVPFIHNCKARCSPQQHDIQIMNISEM
ncbi:42728_t:CDS:2, partial [Gigaspora margarita]